MIYTNLDGYYLNANKLYLFNYSFLVENLEHSGLFQSPTLLVKG